MKPNMSRVKINGNADCLSQYPHEGAGVSEEEEEDMVIRLFTAISVPPELVMLNIVSEVRV